MGTDLDYEQWARLGETRIAGTPWRVRGLLGGVTVVDTVAAKLVWEPRRVTPVYAVPIADIAGELIETASSPVAAEFEHRPVLDPTVPFVAHTARGRAMLLESHGGQVQMYAIDDPALGDRVLIDFDALQWLEEDDPVVAHPRDPFHRIDVHASGRHLVLSIDDVIVVDTVRSKMLAETNLPVRWYVPREDVRVPLVESDTVTWCAYKGRATYASVLLDGVLIPDLGWMYAEPLRDATEVRGLLGIYAERMVGTVDGEVLPHRAMAPPRSQGFPPDRRRAPAEP